MALAFKSIGTVFTTGTTGAATFTANVPTSVAPASGDLLLATAVDWSGAGSTWTTPSGWAVVRNDNDGATQDIGVHVYSKVAGASEANQNFTLSVAELGAMVMLCYSGQDAVNPVDTSNATVTDPATASVTLTTPTVTTTVANDILMLIYAVGSDNNKSASGPTFATPTSTTVRQAATGANTGGSNQFWASFAIFDIVQAASGLSATFSSASTGNATATYGAAAVVVAIKAVAGSSDPFPAGYGRWPQRRPPNMRTLLAR